MSKTRGVLREKSDSEVVFTYQPKEFPILITSVAESFVSSQDYPVNDFKISDLVAKQAGITHLEKASLDKKIEAIALEKVKEVEERAYAEAYKLGAEEGAQKAFEHKKEEIEQNLERLKQVLDFIEGAKPRLLAENEAQLIHLVHLVASKIAMAEIENKSDLILNLLKQVIENLHGEQNVLIRLNSSDLEFVQSMLEKNKKDLSALQKLRLDIGEGVRAGGCIIETDAGSIDATIEERVKNAWNLLAAKTPRIKKGEEPASE